MKQLLTLALLSGASAALAQDLTNNGATITLTGGAVLSVGGALANNSGTLDLSGGGGNNQLYVGGNLVNASGATLTPGTASTVTLNGTAAQQLRLNGAGLANLTVNNASGVTLPASSNADVTGTLTLTNGMVTTAPSATLRLVNGATVSGESSTRYVAGNLAAVKANVPGGAATAFPNGLTVTPSATLTNLTATRTAGLNTAQVSYGTDGSGNNKGIDQIWQTSAPLTNAQVVLSWLSANDNGLTSSLSSAQVWARATAPIAGANWARIGNTQNGTGRSVTGAVPTGASYAFFTASTAAAPLPVTLTAFTALAEGPAAARLNWTTASEFDNASFTVERSTNGLSFTAIGTIPGAGTSLTPRQYTLLDGQLPASATLLYYRLRQLDLDGTAHLSAVVTLAVSTTKVQFAAYPNPAHSQVMVVGAPARATVALIDAVGRLVLQATADESGTTRLRLPDGLATGAYFIRAGASAQPLLID